MIVVSLKWNFIFCLFLVDRLLSLCPRTGYSTLETHPNNPTHGDICRQDNGRNFDCPTGCFKTSSGTSPFCQKSQGNSLPCRVWKCRGKYFIFLLTCFVIRNIDLTFYMSKNLLVLYSIISYSRHKRLHTDILSCVVVFIQETLVEIWR